MSVLRSPSELRHDPLNPRARDANRFELVRLSLRKFGFVLPIYALDDGSLVSGHQRADAAATLGWRAPVVHLKGPVRDLPGLNLTFNRATNDFALTDIHHDQLDVEGCRILLDALPDTEDPFPCLRTVRRSVEQLVTANAGRYNRYAENAARQLASYGVEMPVLITPAGRILNGMGRLQHASGRGRSEIECVVIDEEKAQALQIVVNRLSMDFHLSDGFKDVLRRNAFRRARLRRKHLGSGFTFPIWSGRLQDFDIRANAERLKDTYGPHVLDFGSGHGDEARMLRSIGIKVATFEPYPSKGAPPRRADGRRSALAFLKGLATGRPFSSIVLSSVLNSVPFKEDRDHILAIAAALCAPETALFAVARSRGDPNWREVSAGIGLGSTASRSARFQLTDEPGMSLAELNQNPKVQRYFQPSEFHELFSRYFEEVEVGLHINNVTAICRKPRPVSPDRLKHALLFEFDLPYPDGTMGLADHALDAFAARLGVRFG